jgi:hypothetical protein
VSSKISNITCTLHITAVGIPLPAGLNKQGSQTDENDPEIHPLEASRHLPPEEGADGTLMTGIIYQ